MCAESICPSLYVRGKYIPELTVGCGLDSLQQADWYEELWFPVAARLHLARHSPLTTEVDNIQNELKSHSDKP